MACHGGSVAGNPRRPALQNARILPVVVHPRPDPATAAGFA